MTIVKRCHQPSAIRRQLDPDDTVLRYTIDTVAFPGLDVTKACEVAERRKDCGNRTEDEAGNPGALTAATVHSNGRMNMPCQHVALGVSGRMMGEHKRPVRKRRIDAIEAQIAWRITRATIVVSANKQHVDLIVLAPPLTESAEHRV